MSKVTDTIPGTRFVAKFKSEINASGAISLLVLPAIILVSTFIIFPLLLSLYMSFFEQSLLTLDEPMKFVGLQNYQDIFTIPRLTEVLWNTIIWTILATSFSVLLGFMTGWIIHNKFPYPNIAGSLILIPWIFPAVVGSALWKLMFSGSIGIINEFLVRLGLTSDYIVMLGDPTLSLYPPTIAMIWRVFPLFGLITLIALQSVDSRLYEAAKIDGVPARYRFLFITLPQIRYMLGIGLFFVLITVLRNFTMVWVITEGGPGVSSTVLSVLIFKEAFVRFNLGMASALSVVLFLILAALTIGYVLLMRRQDQTGDHK